MWGRLSYNSKNKHPPCQHIHTHACPLGALRSERSAEEGWGGLGVQGHSASGLEGNQCVCVCVSMPLPCQQCVGTVGWAVSVIGGAPSCTLHAHPRMGVCAHSCVCLGETHCTVYSPNSSTSRWRLHVGGWNLKQTLGLMLSFPLHSPKPFSQAAAGLSKSLSLLPPSLHLG